MGKFIYLLGEWEIVQELLMKLLMKCHPIDKVYQYEKSTNPIRKFGIYIYSLLMSKETSFECWVRNVGIPVRYHSLAHRE